MSNILSEVHPELVAEWSDKNLPLTPDRITYGSNKVVWWKGACGHEWQTSVKARSNGENCPICSGARVIEGVNDLATLKPELADEWSSKNDPLKPTMVTTGSHKKVIWRDKYGHEWTATVKSRALNGTGCPYCSHNKILVGFNDLASQHPQIASEWSERNYPLNIKETRKKGHSFKDYICPDSMEFEKDYFKMGDRYGRVLFLREYASYIKDSMVAELTDLNRNLMMSIDVVPVPTDEAVREAENRLLGVETNITNWQRRQNSNNNFSATVPYDMEQQKKEMKEFLDDLTTRDQRMMFAVITFVHTADSKEQLDNDTEALLTTARKHLCQFGVLKFQQVDGLNTVMPFGVRKIDTFRTLTTESLAVFIPFRVQDIFHENGIYYGQNVISKNMIIADRKQLLNGNSFILGVSGGGKSFAAKGEIENVILSSDSDVIIIDPEREYSQLVKALGGEVIHISATSQNHINAMDMTKEYGDGANPVILKSEFIMSLCEQLIGGSNLGAKQKSIIDRCTASVYRTYQQNNYQGEVPTLQDFREELLKQDEPEAQEIALAIELFTSGSLNTFAKHTNVDTNNRLICYDILDLGKQLMPIGMLVVLDSILNRITQNRAKGRNTFIFIDEIYLLFQHEYSANFLFTLWKRVRKYGAYATGITQNVDDLLQSHTARTMLANSEFIIMLNQASTDRLELAKLLNISDLQMSYITNVEAGHGLIKVGSSLVPFANKFPKNTKLYKLMTTKPGESA